MGRIIPYIIIPYIMENKTCSKPPTRYLFQIPKWCNRRCPKFLENKLSYIPSQITHGNDKSHGRNCMYIYIYIYIANLGYLAKNLIFSWQEWICPLKSQKNKGCGNYPSKVDRLISTHNIHHTQDNKTINILSTWIILHYFITLW